MQDKTRQGHVEACIPPCINPDDEGKLSSNWVTTLYTAWLCLTWLSGDQREAMARRPSRTLPTTAASCLDDKGIILDPSRAQYSVLSVCPSSSPNLPHQRWVFGKFYHKLNTRNIMLHTPKIELNENDRNKISGFGLNISSGPQSRIIFSDSQCWVLLRTFGWHRWRWIKQKHSWRERMVVLACWQDTKAGEV